MNPLKFHPSFGVKNWNDAAVRVQKHFDDMCNNFAECTSVTDEWKNCCSMYHNCITLCDTLYASYRRNNKTIVHCPCMMHQTKLHVAHVHLTTTSNVTGHHWGPKQKLRAGYRAPSWHPRPMCHHSYVWLLDIPGLCNACHILHHWMWYHALSLRYACTRSSGIILTPKLRCAKFSFCCILHCWASPRRKIAYSITLSLTQLIWCAGNRSFRLQTVTHIWTNKWHDAPWNITMPVTKLPQCAMFIQANDVEMKNSTQPSSVHTVNDCVGFHVPLNT